VNRVKTFSMTDIGQRRSMNQDYFFTSEMPVGNLPNLFIVADGMGGHNAGDYASRHAVETIVSVIEKSELTEPVKLLDMAIKQANEEVFRKASEDDSMKGMGTTIVACTLMDKKLYVANVGDSRLYVINQKIYQLTRDHSLVEELIRMGELDKNDARIHEHKNVITRAVGAESTVEVDFYETELEENDEILLCSDGLTNMVKDEDIRKLVKSQRDIAEVTEKLIFTANENGGRDNITVVVIAPFSDEVKGDR